MLSEITAMLAVGDHQRRAAEAVDDSTMMSSTSVSSSDVDSSRTRMSGSAIQARARAMSWRCAAVRLCPSSSTTCSNWPGRIDSRSQAPTAGSPSRPLRRSLRLRVPDVRGDRALEHERVLGDDAEARAEAVELEIAEIDAVDLHRARVGVVGAAQELGDARLARARVGQRHRAPRSSGLHTFRPRLGIVPQDPFVFKGTIASNIRYAKPDATDDEVEAAIRSVGAWDLLSVLPGQFEHVVEEEGHNLTAAQRQLVALARAWIAEPDILVLDESTSLLDTEVEDIIVESIHCLDCTTLMITHRESIASSPTTSSSSTPVASSTPAPRKRSRVPAVPTTGSGASRTRSSPPRRTRNSPQAPSCV